jgi:hypothetical protein
MNSGIMDAENLALRIVQGLTKESLEEYSEERRASVKKNMAIADQLFGRSLEIAKTLGLDIRNLKMFESAMSLVKSMPFSSTIFNVGVKLGSLHLENNTVSATLASNLQKKNLHIPMILPECEFQHEINLKSKKLILLPKGERRDALINGQDLHASGSDFKRGEARIRKDGYKEINSH